MNIKHNNWLPLFCILTAALFLPNIYSQTMPLKIDVDCADFRYDEEVNYLEVYYAMNKSGMSYQKSEQGVFTTSLHMILTIHDGDSIISVQQWKMESTETDTASIDATQSAVDCIKLTIPPGTFTLKLVATDLINVQNSDSVSKTINVLPISANETAISDLQLAGSVRRIKEDPSNPFFKNSLEVMPNPSNFYGATNKYVYYYVELYNIHQKFKDQDYFVKYYIQDSNGNLEEEIKPETRKRSSKYDSAVIYGALKAGELKSGSYILKLDIVDNAENVVLSRAKKFFVYNPTRIPDTKTINTINTAQMYSSSDFSEMTEAEVDEEFEKIRYISQHRDQNFYKSLTSLDEKRKWLFNFWRVSDKTPETEINEFRLEYQRRIQYADKFFKEMGVDGWKTDRGRIYCIYGEANFVERFPSEPSLLPYEIWHYYDLQGGVEFVFADTHENDEYLLMHSNMRGEVKNSNWKSSIGKL